LALAIALSIFLPGALACSVWTTQVDYLGAYVIVENAVCCRSNKVVNYQYSEVAVAGRERRRCHGVFGFHTIECFERNGCWS
jgi:hypothetical protein